MQPWHVTDKLLGDVDLSTTFDMLAHCHFGLCMFVPLFSLLSSFQHHVTQSNISLVSHKSTSHLVDSY